MGEVQREGVLRLNDTGNKRDMESAMRITFLWCLVLAISAVNGHGQSEGWPYSHGKGYLNFDPIQTADGGIVLVLSPGGTLPLNQQNTMIIQKLNPSGQVEWSTNLTGDKGGRVWGGAETHDGIIVLAGVSSSTTDDFTTAGYGQNDVFIASLSGDGQLRGVRKYGTTGNESVISTSSSNDGGLWVYGSKGVDAPMNGGSGEGSKFVMKVDADGKICPLAITAHPVGTTVSGGQQTTISVVATSSSSISYKWQRKDGSTWIDLPSVAGYFGSTTSTLTIESAQPSRVGPYRCAVSAGECTLYSNEASLIVKCPCDE